MNARTSSDDNIIGDENLCSKTPLHFAAFHNSIDIGELLISNGADANAKDIICQIMIILYLINGI